MQLQQQRGSISLPINSSGYEADDLSYSAQIDTDGTNSGDPYLHGTGKQANPAGYSKLALFFKWHIYCPTNSTADYITSSSFLTFHQFFCFRLIAAMWTFCAYSITIYQGQIHFPIYLTNWNHTSILLYFLCSAYICIRTNAGRKTHALDEKLISVESSLSLYDHRVIRTSYIPPDFLHRLTYFLMEHSFVWTTLVVLIYWTTEFPHFLKDHPTPLADFCTGAAHGVTFVLIATDFVLNKIQFVWTHVVLTMAISVAYVTLNCTYCLIAHTFIYHILEWNSHPLVASLATAGTSFFLCGMYAIAHQLCKIRDRKAGVIPPEAGRKWCTFGCE